MAFAADAAWQAGRASLGYFQTGIQPDCGPLPPILEEAGVIFTDWQGKRTVYGPDGFATNGSVYDELLPVLRA